MELTAKQQAEILRPHLQKARPYFIDYIKRLLTNKNFEYWFEEDWNDAERMIFVYDDIEEGNFNIFCYLSGSDEYRFEEANDPGSFTELFNKAVGRPEGSPFIPDELFEYYEENAPEIFREFDEWIGGCWREAAGDGCRLKGIIEFDELGGSVELDEGGRRTRRDDKEEDEEFDDY